MNLRVALSFLYLACHGLVTDCHLHDVNTSGKYRGCSRDRRHVDALAAEVIELDDGIGTLLQCPVEPL